MLPNFDMVGSPNHVRFVYDGDNSASPPGPGEPGPPGPGAIEALFHEYFVSLGLASRRDPVHGPLRLRAVHRRGHPIRRPVHRRRGIKTAEQSALFGGTAGIAL